MMKKWNSRKIYTFCKRWNTWPWLWPPYITIFFLFYFFRFLFFTFFLNKFFLLIWYAGGAGVDEPEFAEPIENITVPAGREVKLACSVKALGPHKVCARRKRNTLFSPFKIIVPIYHPPFFRPYYSTQIQYFLLTQAKSIPSQDKMLCKQGRNHHQPTLLHDMVCYYLLI